MFVINTQSLFEPVIPIVSLSLIFLLVYIISYHSIISYL